MLIRRGHPPMRAHILLRTGGKAPKSLAYGLAQRYGSVVERFRFTPDSRPYRKLSPNPVIILREPDPNAHLALQHYQLVSQRGILCFKSALGLEERGGQVQEKDYQRGHRHRFCHQIKTDEVFGTHNGMG